MNMNRKTAGMIVVAVLLIAGGIWYHHDHLRTSASISSDQQKENNAASSTDSYDLFVPAELIQQLGINPSSTPIQYHDGGTITSGQYESYHRVLAQIPSQGLGDDTIVAFATKDYKTYIGEDQSAAYTNDIFNKAKVVATGNVPETNTPAAIPLGNFMLVRDQAYFGEVASSSMLASLVPGLTFYADTGSSLTNAYSQGASAYVNNDDDVFVNPWLNISWFPKRSL
jgi:hypothetical protein